MKDPNLSNLIVLISNEFTRLFRDRLSPHLSAEVLETHQNLAANLFKPSEIFNPNSTMDEAFEAIVGRPYDHESHGDLDLWKASMRLSKNSGYARSPELVPNASGNPTYAYIVRDRCVEDPTVSWDTRLSAAPDKEYGLTMNEVLALKHANIALAANPHLWEPGRRPPIQQMAFITSQIPQGSLERLGYTCKASNTDGTAFYSRMFGEHSVWVICAKENDRLVITVILHTDRQQIQSRVFDKVISAGQFLTALNQFRDCEGARIEDFSWENVSRRSLTQEIKAWLEANGFPQLCPDDLLSDINNGSVQGTEAQCDYLRAFGHKWDVAKEN